jgi:serine/threonine protein phosphatase PrpC
MKVKCFQLSSSGPVRDHNEDFLLFWEPADFYLLQRSGSIAIVADGVCGEGNGDKASRLAAETALSVFKEAKPESFPTDLVRQDAAVGRGFRAAAGGVVLSPAIVFP